jgi:hypothetical protein
MVVNAIGGTSTEMQSLIRMSMNSIGLALATGTTSRAICLPLGLLVIGLAVFSQARHHHRRDAWTSSRLDSHLLRLLHNPRRTPDPQLAHARCPPHLRRRNLPYLWAKHRNRA